MAVNYSSACKTARLNAVVGQIDAGSSAGTLEIGTTGMASVLAILTLADPCATVSGATMTFDFDPDIEDASANATGTAAAARIKDSDGNVVISGFTVGTSGADIILDSVTIITGQRVVLTTGAITHA